MKTYSDLHAPKGYPDSPIPNELRSPRPDGGSSKVLFKSQISDVASDFSVSKIGNGRGLRELQAQSLYKTQSLGRTWKPDSQIAPKNSVKFRKRSKSWILDTFLSKFYGVSTSKSEDEDIYPEIYVNYKKRFTRQGNYTSYHMNRFKRLRTKTKLFEHVSGEAIDVLTKKKYFYLRADHDTSALQNYKANNYRLERSQLYIESLVNIR